MIRVFVICAECHRQRELMFEGPRVVVELEHDCDAESGFSVPAPDVQLTLGVPA